LRVTPAIAQRLTDHIWTIGELLSACLDNAPASRARSIAGSRYGNSGRESVSVLISIPQCPSSDGTQSRNFLTGGYVLVMFHATSRALPAPTNGCFRLMGETKG
jgi:hypothetical protein